ncbi:hypothetical protein [Mycolicibacterium bacteremicum]|uniref:Uncharacterized protein n=1 Tax=Mycolicibacterium bacteremicum TaxID=564198 RepID=A0A1W9Z518_MYCBA|nr:hypothetical protein [Mycolicibacterium bacteremicum]MCV7433722.1 hypothetical protein [Mycolicibacterium bacteremicum]ORA07239.1 hypothetical protein BST17_01895 [Mycolicibacterium bacteremicum]
MPSKSSTPETIVVVIHAWYEREALRARIIVGSDHIDGDGLDSGRDEYATSVEQVCAAVARAFERLERLP